MQSTASLKDGFVTSLLDEKCSQCESEAEHKIGGVLFCQEHWMAKVAKVDLSLDAENAVIDALTKTRDEMQTETDALTQAIEVLVRRDRK